ncbi:uncharacterized protein C10orf120 homolog [Ochotona curzoniae]|uniref:uncharacterized protein C10orf120 homolog n=1 Tax=Ochotona curzoniae TaxID=130825 RepID=UPI001B347811|nr:uncharacterized protein C10orf120 homolog [Ochotona curzoniae]
MIREWEDGGQPEKPRPGDVGLPERKSVEGTVPQKAGRPVKTRTASSGPHQDEDSLYCPNDLHPTLHLRLWNQLHQSDPRISLGKFSSMEKEILRLGGTHTVATRKFLARKQEEERKMLKELKLQSPSYRQTMECNRQRAIPCPACGPSEKMWTAKVSVPPEEFKMPQREKLTIYKHIERMQLARALRNKQFLTYAERLRGSSLLAGVVLSPAVPDKANDKVKPEEEQAEHKSTKKQEIKMNVVFKSEEPKKCFVCQPKDCKSFFPRKKSERSIAGQTNRNLFPLAEFPGDLMLMNQDFISRGINPCNMTKTCSLEEESFWNE